MLPSYHPLLSRQPAARTDGRRLTVTLALTLILIQTLALTFYRSYISWP